jgi:hypothetical protein
VLLAGHLAVNPLFSFVIKGKIDANYNNIKCYLVFIVDNLFPGIVVYLQSRDSLG